MGRIEKGIMTPISDNTFIFSLQLLNIITTAYGEWYGEVWLFSMHIIAQKERGAFRGGESSTNPKKKKKASNNCWCLSLLVVVSSSFCMGMHMIWPLIMPLVLIFAHFVFSITQFPDRKKEKKKEVKIAEKKTKIIILRCMESLNWEWNIILQRQWLNSRKNFCVHSN